MLLSPAKQSRRFLSCALVACALSPQVARAQTERLDEHEVARRIAWEGPILRGAEEAITEKKAEAKSRRGRLLPSLHLGVQPAYFKTDLRLLLGQNDFRLSEGFGNLLSVTLAQPLTGLLHGTYDFRAALFEATAEKYRARAQLAEVLLQAHSQYLRLLLARAIEETQRASQTDLLAQAEQARARARSGALTRADVLRIEVAAKQAEQGVIEAAAQATALEGYLKEQMGIAASDPSVSFSEALSDARPVWAPTLEEARNQALEARPELLAAHATRSAAELAGRARAFALLPEISVAASYLRADNKVGSSPHQGLNIGFAGVKLDWAVWEWGARFYAQRAAAARARRAEHMLNETQRAVGGDVAAKHATLTARIHAIDVANDGLVSALEAYRVMVAMRDVGEATTTDLLDARAALTHSRASALRARHEAAIAEVEMAQAVGMLGQPHKTRHREMPHKASPRSLDLDWPAEKSGE